MKKTVETEIVSCRVPKVDKEHFTSIAKSKGISLSEYNKRALYMMDDNVILNKEELISKYIKLKAEMDLIENKECRLSVKQGLEELVCLILN